jgi:hypothetical protein
MLKEPPQDQLDEPTLSKEVYHFALDRIEALAGALRTRPKSAS